jgi:hypothetical protein
MPPYAFFPVDRGRCRHRQEDKAFVREKIYSRLRKDGFKPWLDTENLIPGQNWRNVIPAVVRDWDVIVVCCSQKSIKKEGYLQEELEHALEIAGKKAEGAIFIIPLRLDDVELPEKLRNLEAADFFSTPLGGGEEAGYRRLVQALHFCAGQIGATVLNPSQMFERGDEFYKAQKYIEAHEWFLQAAEAGHAGAMNMLGVLYNNGYGVARDYDQARHWQEKSAEAGNPSAMHNLGLSYESGRGVATDLKKAQEWYRKATATGFKPSKEKLRNLSFFSLLHSWYLYSTVALILIVIAGLSIAPRLISPPKSNPSATPAPVPSATGSPKSRPATTPNLSPTVTPAASQTSSPSLPLPTPAPIPTGAIIVVDFESGDEILIDGKAVDTANLKSGDLRFDRPLGTHKVGVQRKNYLPWNGSGDVHSYSPYSVDLSWVLRPNFTGDWNFPSEAITPGMRKECNAGGNGKLHFEMPDNNTLKGSLSFQCASSTPGGPTQSREFAVSLRGAELWHSWEPKMLRLQIEWPWIGYLKHQAWLDLERNPEVTELSGYIKEEGEGKEFSLGITLRRQPASQPGK